METSVKQRTVTMGRILMGALPAAALLALTGCQGAGIGKPPANVPKSDAQQLQEHMVGSFSSATQSAADPENYYDIRLHMAAIWNARTDGPWLYVEQAAAQNLERPYRQRVYRLSALPDTSIESQVFELPGDPIRLAGAWRDPALLDAIKPEQLVLRAGCGVILRRQPDGSFAGKTAGTGCESALRAARYATSEVTVAPHELRSWDRGFNERNEQVWGATEGPYIFRRVSAAEATRPPASPAASQPALAPAGNTGTQGNDE